jgi:hypothetical protein
MQKILSKSKKGFTSGMTSAILGVILIAVFLVAGFVILGGLKTTLATTEGNVATGTVTNETNAYLNNTGYLLKYAGAEGFTNPTITAIWGVQEGVYNLSKAVGNAKVTSQGLVTNTSTAVANCSYSYTYTYVGNYSEAYNSTKTMISSLSEIPNWIPILIIIVIAGLILGLVMSWGKGNKNQGM